MQRGVERSSSHRRAACTARPARRLPVDETPPLAPLTAYAESKVRSGAVARRARERRLLARVAAVRHRLRCLAAASARHRPQQSRRMGVDDRCGPPSERRHSLAAADPRRGHGGSDRGSSRGAARPHPRRGVQRRRLRCELRRPRSRPDGGGRGNGGRGGVRPGRGHGSAELQGRLLEDRRNAGCVPTAIGMRRKERGS